MFGRARRDRSRRGGTRGPGAGLAERAATFTGAPDLQKRAGRLAAGLLRQWPRSALAVCKTAGNGVGAAAAREAPGCGSPAWTDGRALPATAAPPAAGVHRRPPPRIHEPKKFESFERMNSIHETSGNFDSCKSCKRLETSRLHELHGSKFPFVSRIECIRSKLSNFYAHVSEVPVLKHIRPDTTFRYDGRDTASRPNTRRRAREAPHPSVEELSFKPNTIICKKKRMTDSDEHLVNVLKGEATFHLSCLEVI